MRLLLFFLLLSIVSCSNPLPSDSEGPRSFPKNVTLSPLPGHLKEPFFVVSGDLYGGDVISFFNSSCEEENLLVKTTRGGLNSGILLNINNLNSSNSFYFLFEKKCYFWGEVIHDSVAPEDPLFTPLFLSDLNGLLTNKSLIEVNLQPSDLSSSTADGIRFYGNPQKTIPLGEALLGRGGGLLLTPNITNSIYFSYIDYAGNESGVFNSGVLITNDSIPPNPPHFPLGEVIHTSNNLITVGASPSTDTSSVEVLIMSSGEVLSIPHFGLPVSFTLNLVQNSENVIIVTALDHLGNRSLDTTLKIFHDNIPPSTPVLTENSAQKVLIPLKGPDSSLSFKCEEESTVRIVNGDDFNQIGVGESDEDINFTLPHSNGTNNIVVYCVDLARNESLPLTLTVAGDSTPPSLGALSLELLGLNGSYTNKSIISISGTPSIDTNIVKIIPNGGSEVLSTRSNFISGINFSPINNAENIILISYIDLSGNESLPQEIRFTHDNIAPPIKITYPLNGKSIRSDGIIRGECEGFPVRVMVNDVETTINCINGGWALSLNNTLTHGDSLTIIASETDLAQNTGTDSSIVTIDNVSPAVAVDLSSFPTPTRFKNQIITGSCEPGLSVFLTGDSEGVFYCLAGNFLSVVDIQESGSKNFTFTQTDYAGNSTSTSVQLDFLLDTPPSPVLSYETRKYQGMVINNGLLRVSGDSHGYRVIIAKDQNGENIIREISSGLFTTGVNITLVPEAQNSLWVFAIDSAGNLSSPEYIGVTHRSILSKKYDVISSDIISSRVLGEGVEYEFKVTIKNSSFDTNVGGGVILEGFTVETSTSELTVLNPNNCGGAPLYAGEECGFSIIALFNERPLLDDKTPLAKREKFTLRFVDNSSKSFKFHYDMAPVHIQSVARSFNSNQEIFSKGGLETLYAEAFSRIPAYLDFDLERYSTVPSDVLRSYQVNSGRKHYSFCHDNSNYLCAYPSGKSNMKEVTFTENIGSLYPVSGFTTKERKLTFLGKVLDWDFFTLDEVDILSVSSGPSYVFAYNVIHKTHGVYKFDLDVQTTHILPHTEWPNSSFLYSLFKTRSGPGVVRSRVVKIDKSKPSFQLSAPFSRFEDLIHSEIEVFPGSGMGFYKNHLVVTKSSGVLNLINLSTGIESTLPLNNTDEYICEGSAFTHNFNGNIESKVSLYKNQNLGLFPLCKNGETRASSLIKIKNTGEIVYLNDNRPFYITNFSLLVNDSFYMRLSFDFGNKLIFWSEEESSLYENELMEGNYLAMNDSYSIGGLSNNRFFTAINGSLKIFSRDQFGLENGLFELTILGSERVFRVGDSLFLLSPTTGVVRYLDINNDYKIYSYKSIPGMVNFYVLGVFKGFVYFQTGSEFSRLPLYSK